MTEGVAGNVAKGHQTGGILRAHSQNAAAVQITTDGHVQIIEIIAADAVEQRIGERRNPDDTAAV